MNLTSCRSTCTANGPRTPQFKFNNLFNEHFPSYFFKSILLHKNWRGGDESLLKNGTIDDFAYKTCYSGAGFTLRGASGI